MNDLTKSYYEIAHEEAAKGKYEGAAGALMSEEEAAKAALAAGLEEDSEEYWDFIHRKVDPQGYGKESGTVARDRQSPPYKDKPGTDQSPNGEMSTSGATTIDLDSMSDEELMELEQAIQSKMTRYK
jgi:hypothetical protein